MGIALKPRILLVEDDKTGLEIGLYNLREAGYSAAGAPDGIGGLEIFRSKHFDLVITDIKMPGMSGMELLDEIHRSSPDTPVIVITAYAEVELAVSAIKAGAHDFIGKPFNRDQLAISVEKALATGRLKRELRRLRIESRRVERPIVFRSREMENILKMTDKVAQSDATVLITGESGTGKELIARRIHVRSNRADKPFVAVNTAAIPSALLESELFGHEKGAFTGASRSRSGRFKQARGGTLFLDEIAELPADLQVKLLRVLQEGTVDVVGADKPEVIDVRVVSATNRDLATEVAEGRFREDLFFRLNVIGIRLPPLRGRPADIELLTWHFLSCFAPEKDWTVPESVLDHMRAHDWPGNVRELENVCHRIAVLSASSDVSERDLPFVDGDRSGQSEPPDGDPFEEWPPLPRDGLSLLDLEKRLIERVLVRQHRNVSRAAVYLSVPRHILSYRMQKYGIENK